MSKKFTPEEEVIESNGESPVIPYQERVNSIAYGNVPTETVQKITRVSSVITVLVAGLALFSDGYNAQIIGYMEPLFKELYKDHSYSDTIKTRLSNSYLIGEIFGMLFFGFIIDKVGRRTGIVFATSFLILGAVLSTAAHGKNQLGMCEYPELSVDPLFMYASWC